MTPPPARATRRSAGALAAFWLLAAVLVAGALAPLLANDVPLAARVRGTWSFPAFADLVGARPGGPDDLTWKQWWSRLPPGGDDFAVMPPWPYGPGETDVARSAQTPSYAHWLGCDEAGRDVLARLVHGAGAIVWLALPAVLLGGLVGTLLGAWGGFRGGLADAALLRLVELFLCFPVLLFLLFAVTFFGSSSIAFVLVLASLLWTSFARVVRGEMPSLRERDFVHVARALGVPEWRILARHVLPQVRSSIAVTAAFCVAGAAVAESTLSFLGLGPGDVPSSWGDMLRKGAAHAVVGVWHTWLFPALAIGTVVVCCHVLADRSRRRDAA